MNDTKWNEIFKTFYEIECEKGFPVIEYKTKMLSGYDSEYDYTWSHFGEMFEDYKEIDTLTIKLTIDNKNIVFDKLKRIHVPAETIDDYIIKYGYNTNCDYFE